MTKFEYIKLLISEMDADEFSAFIVYIISEYVSDDKIELLSTMRDEFREDLQEVVDDVKITNIQNLRSMMLNDDVLISIFFGWSEFFRDGCPKGAHEASKCADDIDCRMCYKMWGELPCDNIGKMPEFVDHEEKIDD